MLINKMKYIKTGTTEEEQCKKVKEEVNEFLEAISKDDKNNIIEEFYDVIQAMLGLIRIKGLGYMLKAGLKKHNIKLKSRLWEMSKIK